MEDKEGRRERQWSETRERECAGERGKERGGGGGGMVECWKRDGRKRECGRISEHGGEGWTRRRGERECGGERGGREGGRERWKSAYPRAHMDPQSPAVLA